MLSTRDRGFFFILYWLWVVSSGEIIFPRMSFWLPWLIVSIKWLGQVIFWLPWKKISFQHSRLFFFLFSTRRRFWSYLHFQNGHVLYIRLPITACLNMLQLLVRQFWFCTFVFKTRRIRLKYHEYIGFICSSWCVGWGVILVTIGICNKKKLVQPITCNVVLKWYRRCFWAWPDKNVGVCLSNTFWLAFASWLI